MLQYVFIACDLRKNNTRNVELFLAPVRFLVGRGNSKISKVLLLLIWMLLFKLYYLETIKSPTV